jgi:flavin-dependent dehydrogenase
LLLAQWGHEVRLITRLPGHRTLPVSLPPSCGKLFDAIGIGVAVDRAGILRSAGNTVWWGRAEARVEPFADGMRGWHVDVGALSEVILVAAVDAGVRIERTTITREDSMTDTEGTCVLDCTGRTGVIARALGLREFVAGPRTVALVGEWHRRDAWPVPDPTHTLIESYDDGWMWSVSTADGVRHIAAMVDPQRSALARGEPSSEVYLAEIGKTRAFKSLIDSATLVDGPRGFDASAYRSTAYAGANWLLVGDAGSFIDPLSSAGVKKALASAWLAAIATNTALMNPTMRAAAFEFFSAREREIEQQLSRESRRFLADAAAGHARPFWDERSDETGTEAADSEDVRRAFEALKARDTWTPRIGPHTGIEPRACIRGNQIVLDRHVVSVDQPPGVRYIRGVDMVVLIELAQATRQVPELFETYVQRMGSVPLPDFLFAVATAVARGWLVSE